PFEVASVSPNCTPTLNESSWLGDRLLCCRRHRPHFWPQCRKPVFCLNGHGDAIAAALHEFIFRPSSTELRLESWSTGSSAEIVVENDQRSVRPYSNSRSWLCGERPFFLVSDALVRLVALGRIALLLIRDTPMHRTAIFEFLPAFFDARFLD